MTNEEMKQLRDELVALRRPVTNSPSAEVMIGKDLDAAWMEYWAYNVSLDSTERISKIVFYDAFRYGRKFGRAQGQAEITTLRSQVATMREVLTSIASEHHPRHVEEEYWLNLERASCATVLAHDTTIAREALQSLDKKEGTK